MFDHFPVQESVLSHIIGVCLFLKSLDTVYTVKITVNTRAPDSLILGRMCYQIPSGGYSQPSLIPRPHETLVRSYSQPSTQLSIAWNTLLQERTWTGG